MEKRILDEVQNQLMYHVKAKDRTRANQSGEEPWFETFRRLAKEQGCSLCDASLVEFDCKKVSLTREQVDSLKLRHDKDKPNPEGSKLPPVIFSDGTGLHLIDGCTRVNRFLGRHDKNSQMGVIVVFENQVGWGL